MHLGRKPDPLTVYVQPGYPLTVTWILQEGTWTDAPTLHIEGTAYPATVVGAEATLTLPVGVVDAVPDRSDARLSLGTMLWAAGRVEVLA